MNELMKKDIANLFHIRPQTAGQIIHGKKWKHLLAEVTQ